MSYLNIKSLNFKYMNKLILKNITVDIEKGNFIALLGPNGSGKSTLLKNIAFILKPNSGSIEIENKEIRNLTLSQISQKVSYVPQEIEAHFSFTVEETVLMGRMPYQTRFQKNSKKDLEIA